MGNYKGFGDSKFVPALPVEKLEAFILSTEAAKNPAMASLWQQVLNRCTHVLILIYGTF